MKTIFYPHTLVVYLFFLFSFTSVQATTPFPGITNFNHLYNGSFTDLTGIRSAGAEGLLASNVDGYNFRLYAGSNAIDCGIGIRPLTGQSALVYGYSFSRSTRLNALEISSNDGKYFDLQSVDITIDGLSPGITGNVRLVGYQFGVLVPGAVLTQPVTASSHGGTLINFNTSAIKNFIGITSFRIEPDADCSISGAIGVDNIKANHFRTVLPVTLLRFDAALKPNNNVFLYWSTTLESDAEYFILSKCNGKNDFTEITRIKANAVLNGINEYSFIDTDPLNGNNFYKLSQADHVGEITDLDIEVIKVSLKDKTVLYPNPVLGSSFQLQNPVTDFKESGYIIFDAMGKQIQTGSITNSLQTIPVYNMPAGIYILKYGEKQIIRFQKK